MNDSKSLFERALRVTPGGVHSPVRAFKSVGSTPVFFQSAQGAHLVSVEGKRYVDFCQSFGPLILGHRDPEVQEVVHKMVDTAWSFGACEPYSLALAEWITENCPWIKKVRFLNSGTEAVMTALRVARAATGRSKVLKFDGCYHGHVDSMLVQAGSGLAGQADSSSAGVGSDTAQNTLVGKLDSEENVKEIFAQHGKDIAAVIIEPLPANYGLLIQRKEFIQTICDLAKKNGSLIIFDEVISGFRIGLGGMVQYLGLTPDLVTYGKIIGGGFPVGAVGGKAELMDLIAPMGPVYQAGTLSGSPVGMAAGLATLTKAKRESVHQKLSDRMIPWARAVNSIFSKQSLPYQMMFQDSLFWIHLTSDGPIRRLDQIPAKQSAGFKILFHAMLANGIYFPPSGYEVGFLSLAHDQVVLNSVLEGVEKSCHEIASQGFKI